ncbi:MAG: group 1 truncated hemoglobin [Alphaproteobacteria bacterium CG_4_9_14_3_um_filter_47_13]|nr:MAG: group 1 truncated hemoglobin [Alphaproteobacteria bacterium CG_4_9_14_3_um_filter_47_13]
MPNQGQTLFERIGGEFTINAVVDEFYDRVLNDDRINYFFDNISMDMQIRKLKVFLKLAFEEQKTYPSFEMRKAHAPLVERGLNDTHIDILLEHMTQTLKIHKVPLDVIEETINKIEKYRDDVLNR